MLPLHFSLCTARYHKLVFLKFRVNIWYYRLISDVHDKATSLNIVIYFESIQKAPEGQSTVSLKKFDCCTVIK